MRVGRGERVYMKRRLNCNHLALATILSNMVRSKRYQVGKIRLNSVGLRLLEGDGSLRWGRGGGVVLYVVVVS